MSKDLQPIPFPKHWKYGCGNVTLIDCEEGKISSEEAHSMEVVMCAAQFTTDVEGNHVFFRIPPAVALVIVRALKEQYPHEYLASIRK